MNRDRERLLSCCMFHVAVAQNSRLHHLGCMVHRPCMSHVAWHVPVALSSILLYLPYVRLYH